MTELYHCTCDPHGDNARCDRPCARPNHERQTMRVSNLLNTPKQKAYDSSESRVAQWISDRTDLGAGDDPVGFILASYDHKIFEFNKLRQTTDKEIQNLRRILERWLKAAESGIWRDRSNLSLASTMLADDTREALKNQSK